MSATVAAARYFDGVSARPQYVQVTASEAGLVFVAENGLRQIWAAAEIRRIPGEKGDRELRLTALGSAATLEFADARLLDLLRGTVPDLEERSRLTRRWLRRIAGWTAVGTGVVAAAYFLLPYLAGFLASLVPQSWEDRLGDRLLPVVVEALKQPGDSGRACSDDRALRPLGRLVGQLAAAGGLPRRPDVQLLDLRMRNAFALPGDRVVVTRGLVDFMESPDELAAVLGHEFGHLKHKDAVAGVIRYLGWDALASVVLGTGITASLGRTLALAANGRAVETRADGYAVATLRTAGLDGKGAASFMQRMATSEGMDLGYMSSHPPSADRAAAMAAGAASGRAAMTAGEWAALKRACD